MLTSIRSSIAGARQWLTLLLVAASAAWLWSAFAKVRADRDGLLHTAELICAATGSGFAAEGKLLRGARCLARARELAGFELAAQTESARLLAESLTEHSNRAEADAVLARSAAENARAAAARMERAENAIAKDDRVGDDWFDAVGELAGLR